MKDKIFRLILFIAALMILLLTAGIIYALVSRSLEAFGEYGIWGFISNAEWILEALLRVWCALFYHGNALYGVLCAFICIPFSLSVALFNGEYFKGTRISSAVSSVVDLLAGSHQSCMACGVL